MGHLIRAVDPSPGPEVAPESSHSRMATRQCRGCFLSHCPGKLHCLAGSPSVSIVPASSQFNPFLAAGPPCPPCQMIIPRSQITTAEPLQLEFPLPCQLFDLSPRETKGLPSPGDAAWVTIKGRACGTAQERVPLREGLAPTAPLWVSPGTGCLTLLKCPILGSTTYLSPASRHPTPKGHMTEQSPGGGPHVFVQSSWGSSV